MTALALILMLALGVLVAPAVTTAQPGGKMPRVGVLEPGSQQRPSGCLPAFQQGLRDLGYVEGQTIRLEYRYAEEQRDRLPALAARAGPARAGRHLAAHDHRSTRRQADDHHDPC